MPVFFGLIAALGWGAGDFLASYNGRQFGVVRTMLLNMVAGTLVLSQWVALDRHNGIERIGTASSTAWLAAVLAVPLLLGATLSLFTALARGTLGIVAPVTASYGGVTTALALVSGEPVAPAAVGGLALAIAGVVAVSAAGGRSSQSLRGIGHAAGAALEHNRIRSGRILRA